MNTEVDTSMDIYTDIYTTMDVCSRPPKLVFIVPYRDRKQHMVFFTTYIQKIMEDIPKEDWTYFFVHQTDTRPFNRGAMKNIGFLAMKYKYPNDYKNIILIFNDIDTLPYDKNVLDFNTTHGFIKHYYGFKFALGGIFSITGDDFEKTNGFPNFWAWGGEDNLINERAKKVGITINRDNFFSLGDMNILQFADGLKRLICRDELATTLQNDNIDGIITIKNLNYQFRDDLHMIDVFSFDTLISPNILKFEEQNIDKIGKIRVNTNSGLANNNMKKTFFSEINREKPGGVNRNIDRSYQQLVSGESNQVLSHILESPTPLTPLTPYVHINTVIQPQLPFTTNIFNKQNKTSINGPDVMGGSGQMYRSSPSIPTYIPTRELSIQQQGAIFSRRGTPDASVVLPLNNLISSVSSSNKPHRKFGMRSLFM
jgi:hypothetical protein